MMPMASPPSYIPNWNMMPHRKKRFEAPYTGVMQPMDFNVRHLGMHVQTAIPHVPFGPVPLPRYFMRLLVWVCCEKYKFSALTPEQYQYICMIWHVNTCGMQWFHKFLEMKGILKKVWGADLVTNYECISSFKLLWNMQEKRDRDMNIRLQNVLHKFWMLICRKVVLNLSTLFLISKH